MFAKLWNDDAGIVGMEYLFVATIIGLGLVIGLSAVEGALNAELTELGSAILALSQGYSISGQSGCKATKQGTTVLDTPGNVDFGFLPPGGTVAAVTVGLNETLCGTPGTVAAP